MKKSSKTKDKEQKGKGKEKGKRRTKARMKKIRRFRVIAKFLTSSTR